MESFSSTSGLYSVLYSDPDAPNGYYVLVNRGTELHDLVDSSENDLQAFGLESRQYTEAISLAIRLSRSYGHVSFSGHSLGGGLAQAQAIATYGSAIVFDAAAIRPETLGYAQIRVDQRDIDLAFESGQIQAFSLDGDPLTIGQDVAPPVIAGIVRDYVSNWNPNATLEEALRATAARELVERFPGGIAAIPRSVLDRNADLAVYDIRGLPSSPPNDSIPYFVMTERGYSRGQGGWASAARHEVNHIVIGLAAITQQNLTLGDTWRPLRR